jgi:hypothetical protein
VHIGGTDFDKQLSLQGLMPLFGYGSRMKSGAYMPTSHHMNLATWHTINSVYSQKSQLALGSMRYDIEDTGGIDRLFKLIEQRAGHWLAMEVEETKIQLTHADSRHVRWTASNRPERGTEPCAVRIGHRRPAGARARQRHPAARRLGGRGAGGHGVLHRRFQRHSGPAQQRLGDAAECAACGREHLWQHRQRSGDRGRKRYGS